MRSWVIVIVVWFVFVFISIVIVSFLAYQEFNKGKWRWNSSYKPFPPWNFLLLLLAAFIIGIIWFAVECSNERDIGKTRAWLFIGFFTGTFALACLCFYLYWNKAEKWSFVTRNPEIVDTRSQRRTSPTENHVGRNLAFLTQSFKDEDGKITSNSNYGMDLGQLDDILVLQDLSRPNAEYCLNLLNSEAPVIRRKQLKTEKAADVVLIHQEPSQQPEVLTLQDFVTRDFQC